MLGRRVLISVLVLAAALLCSPEAAAQDFETIFNGTTAPEVRDRRHVVAVAVGSSFRLLPLIEELRKYAGPSLTLLVYSDHENASETEPVVVFVDGYLESFRDRPRSSMTAPTIAESTRLATSIERGDRIGAICTDGTRTTSTRAPACVLNGGVEHWFYTAVATTHGNIVVAAICTDYRLVSGTGGRCGRVGVLAEVKAIDYSPPSLAPDPDRDPTSPGVHVVAPLPEPSLQAPTIADSNVEWTERRNGNIGFAWSASVANPNAEPVDALVSLQLRDIDGEIILSAEKVVSVDGGATVDVSDNGTVTEEEARAADRWTFDVAIAEHDDENVSNQDVYEPSDIEIIVDLEAETVRLTNTGDEQVDLNRWTLVSKNGGESFTFRFFKLPAGGTVVLSSGPGAISRLPETYLWTVSEIWSNGGDIAELRDADGRIRARTNADGSPRR